MVADVEDNPSLSEGFGFYSSLILLNSLIAITLYCMTNSKKMPNYEMVPRKEVNLLLRLNIGIPFCIVLYGTVLWFADFGGPRENMLSSVIGIRSTNILNVIICALTTLLTFVIVLNGSVLLNNAKKKFEEHISAGSEIQDIKACVVCVWNGFWSTFLFKALRGRGASITCADEWKHPSTRNAIKNMVADGVPEESIKREEKPLAISEFVRILKPNGYLFVVVFAFSAASTRALFEKSGLTDVTSVTCWSCIPLTLVKAKAPSQKNSNFVVTISEPINGGALLSTTDNYDSEDDTNIETNESTSLINGGDKFSMPSHLSFVNVLMLSLLIFMIGCVFAIWAAWPTLNTQYLRITNGWLVPIANSFALIWVNILDVLREDSRAEDATQTSLTKKFLKYSAFGILGATVFNLIIWLPPMLIGLIIAYRHLQPWIGSVLNAVVMTVLITTLIRIGRKIEARRTV